jgi:hypothetical protein
MPNNIFYDPASAGLNQGLQVGMMLRRMQDEETQAQQQQQNYQQQQRQEGNQRDAAMGLALFRQGYRYATPDELAQAQLPAAPQPTATQTSGAPSAGFSGTGASGTDLSDPGDESSGSASLGTGSPAAGAPAAGGSVLPPMPQTESIASRIFHYTDQSGKDHAVIRPSQQEVQQQAQQQAQAEEAGRQVAINAGHAENLRRFGYIPDPAALDRMGIKNLPGGVLPAESLPTFISSVAKLRISDAEAAGDPIVNAFHPMTDKDGNTYMALVHRSGITEFPQIGKIAKAPTSDDDNTPQYTPGQIAQAQTRHDKLQLAEQEANSTAARYGNALVAADPYIQQEPGTTPKNNPNFTGNIINPQTGKPQPYNDLVKASYQNTITQAQKKAAILAEQQRKIRQTYGFGEYAPGAQQQQQAQPATAPPAAAPVTPATLAPQPKVAPLAKVQAFAKAHNLSLDQARATVKQQGWAIQGE